MKLFFPAAIAVLGILSSCAKEDPVLEPEESKETAQETAVEASPYVKGVSVVQLSDDMIDLIEGDMNEGKLATRSMGLNQALDELGIKSMYRLFPYAGEYEPRTRKEGLHKWYVVEYQDSIPQTKAAIELESIEGVEYVEARRKIKTAEFNDPYFGQQWGINNSTGFDVNVKPVWNYYTVGSSNVIVAVVDQGVDLDHPDLADNTIKDRGEGSYNFCDNNFLINPGNHGTHVAGIISAVNNNGVGISGIAGGDYENGIPGVRIMSCQIFGGKGNANHNSAITYAADHGAVIANNSWGYDFDYNEDGVLSDDELADALSATTSVSDSVAFEYFNKYAGCDNAGNQLPDSPMKGGLVLFSAGNDGIRNGTPANCQNVVAVGSMASNGTRSSFSNYGDWVDITAPGSSIYSTIVDGYGYMSGTSMSCPMASGVAALIVSYYGGPGFTREILLDRLVNGANKTSVNPRLQVGGMADALGSITYGEDTTPEKVTDLSASSHSNYIDVEWTATTDENGIPAYGYILFYGRNKEAVAKATAATPGMGVQHKTYTPSVKAGEKVQVSLSDFYFDTDYYFAVAAYSYGLSYSENSNVVKVATESNNAPVITCDYSGTTTLRSFQSISVPLTVTEPDGHDFTITYTSGSSADTFMNSTENGVKGGKINVTAPNGEPGTYTAVVTATDSYGLASKFEFKYTILENTPPVVTNDIDDLLMTSSGQESTYSVGEHFTDEDGETLAYSASSSNGAVAHATVTNGVLYVTALSYGSTVITVTATDAKGKTAEIQFNVLVREAGIEYAAYPSPVETNLYIATGASLASTSVKVTSLSGQTVYEATSESSAFEPVVVDMSKCAPGRYTLKLAFGGKEYTQQIVKK